MINIYLLKIIITNNKKLLIFLLPSLLISLANCSEKWPKTASGLPSTAGTTASIAFIRRGKIYIGHVGDSAIVLGVQDPDNPDIWRADPLTRDHKQESLGEKKLSDLVSW